mmetsp:Transcript_36479/g.94132  ORF Transcript_36479/g.94132 Transcript_36479/m.94132 type:complete len:216 (-) Transcript_36479:8-655(-)
MKPDLFRSRELHNLRTSPKPMDRAAAQRTEKDTRPFPLGSSSSRHARTKLKYLRRQAALNAAACSSHCASCSAMDWPPAVPPRNVVLVLPNVMVENVVDVMRESADAGLLPQALSWLPAGWMAVSSNPLFSAEKKPLEPDAPLLKLLAKLVIDPLADAGMVSVRGFRGVTPLLPQARAPPPRTTSPCASHWRQSLDRDCGSSGGLGRTKSIATGL